MHPITCAPDAEWYEYKNHCDGSREGSEDGDDY